MRIIDIGQLGFKAQAVIFWSFFWRFALITVVAELIGGVVVGEALIWIFTPHGLIMPLLVGGALGVLSGLFVFYIYIRWLLGSRLGRYRLILTSAED